tara:strand:- start:552 stop:2129 length:1578 start_codon:yes stop_codon:yes gene_type:complete
MKIKSSNFYLGFSLLVPFILLGLAEIMLFLGHKATGKHFFKNTIETRAVHKLDRTSLSYLPANNAPTVKKVAVFGGSSAAGYGSEVSFADLLQIKLGNSFIFHNYARSGNPFVGYQSRKLRALLPFYDIIILYAGHNEGIGHLHSRVADRNASFNWPNGKELKVSEVQAYSKRTDWEIQASVDAQASNSLRSYLLKLRSPIFLSNLPHIIKHKILPKQSLALSSNTSKPEESSTSLKDSNPASNQMNLRYPFDVSNEYFSDSDKEKIVNSFKREILEIISLLSSDQKLIIVTPVANDLYPPYLNYFPGSTGGEISRQSKNTALAYEYLFNGNLNQSKLYSDRITQGAHKHYINSIYDCATPSAKSFNFYDFALTSSCLDSLSAVRDKDALSMRVLTPINKFILSLRDYSDNVIVVNAMDSFSSIKSSRSYLEKFVDILHPSSEGHLLIARDLLPVLKASYTGELLPNSRLGSLAQYFDQCSEQSIHQIRVNYGWFKRFLPISSVPDVHYHYLNKAAEKLAYCGVE